VDNTSVKYPRLGRKIRKRSYRFSLSRLGSLDQTKCGLDSAVVFILTFDTQENFPFRSIISIIHLAIALFPDLLLFSILVKISICSQYEKSPLRIDTRRLPRRANKTIAPADHQQQSSVTRRHVSCLLADRVFVSTSQSRAHASPRGLID